MEGSDTKFCDNCGAKLEQNAEFCNECGTKAENNQLQVKPIKTQEKNKVMVLLIIVLVLVFLAGVVVYVLYSGVFRSSKIEKEQMQLTEEVTPEETSEEDILEEPEETTLKESLEWNESSEDIEAFKELSLSAFPELSIEEALKDDYSVISWKYACNDETKYLMCNYFFEKNDCTIIFYKDIYDSLNVAEYYIKGKLQEKELVKEALKKIFVREPAVNDESSENPDVNVIEDPKKTHEAVPSVSVPSAYPEEGVYTNYEEENLPYNTDLEIIPKNDTSFSYKITRRTGARGNEKLDELVLSGIMTHDVILGADSEHIAYFSDSESGAYVVCYDYGYVDNGYGTLVQNITLALGGAEYITSTSGEQFCINWIY